MWIFDTSRDKKLYHTGLFILRLVVGAFMLTHGIQKWTMLFSASGAEGFPDPLGVGANASLALAVFAEVACSALIIIGLCTRIVVIPLIVTMFVAVFVVHAHDGFEKQELGGLYLTIYILLLITGSGKYSIDHFIHKKTRKRVYS